METLKLTREELKEFIGFPYAVWGLEELKKENKKHDILPYPKG